MQAAFFDLDKTILARSSGLALGPNFYREGLISKRLLLRGMAAQIVFLLLGADESKMEKMRKKALELTKGWDRAKIQSIVEEVMGDVLQPIIYKEALELIREHQAEGRKVYIVSSSPLEIVAPLGNLLGVDGSLASRARVDEEGKYAGELEFYCYGASKVQAMQELADQEGIDLSESFAYSDSATDLPMLEAVGHPVATNPDRDLRRIAAERGWDVRNFERPVTIRKRISEIPPRGAALGGGVALTIAGLAGFIWLRRRAKKAKPKERTMRRLLAVMPGASRG